MSELVGRLICTLSLGMLVIVLPLLGIVVWSLCEMIWEGKSYKDTLGYFTYEERFKRRYKDE